MFFAANNISIAEENSAAANSFKTKQHLSGSNFLRLLFIYHHLSSVYILSYEPDCLVYKIIFWAEISNIPSYIVYHLIKTKPSSETLKKWKIIQKIVYTIVRIPILGYHSYYIYLSVEDKTPFFIGFPVYLMGIIWTLFIVVNN